MAKLKIGFLIAIESFRIMKRNPKVLFFPLLSFTFSLIMVAVLISPLLFYESGFVKMSFNHWEKALCHYLPGIEKVAKQTDPRMTQKDLISLYSLKVLCYFVLSYLLLHFSIIFFNAALVKFIVDNLQSRKVSVRGSLLFCVSRWKLILSWSLISGAVSGIVEFLERELNSVSRWVLKTIGISWNLVTFLVLPVLVCEKVSVLGTFRRSAQLFKKTWGERLIAGFTVQAFWGTLMLFLTIIVVVFIVTGGHAFFIVDELHILFGGFVFVALGVVLGICSGVTLVILQSILYCYAVEGVIPQNVNKNLMDRLWETKGAKVSDHK